jgi:hypothetical protein
MRTFYRLTKNGRLVEDYDNLPQAMVRGDTMEGVVLMWRDTSEEPESGWWANGDGDIVERNEYEISLVKKRT